MCNKDRPVQNGMPGGSVLGAEDGPNESISFVYPVGKSSDGPLPFEFSSLHPDNNSSSSSSGSSSKGDEKSKQAEGHNDEKEPSTAKGRQEAIKHTTPSSTTNQASSSSSSSSKLSFSSLPSALSFLFEKSWKKVNSVEAVAKDRLGCRPRANSTDGELNLPRGGLCDEHMVLAAHKWDEQWKSSRPRGFINLGNTCYLNSTLQCLSHIPALAQCLVESYRGFESGGSMHYNRNGKKKNKTVNQGERITLLLRSLVRQVHPQKEGSNKSGAVSPREIVRSVPLLGKIGNRNGYSFRPGRQEDAHEFLVHLLDAMQDGELLAAGE